MEIRSAKFFLASGITLAVLALIVGVMMWFGQQHLGKLKAQQQSHEQSRQQAEQAHASIKVADPASTSLADKKQAAVEHCRQVPGIKAWLGCMEREGVNTRELLAGGSDK
jgi:flagellar basal body-associated protein FliL